MPKAIPAEDRRVILTTRIDPKTMEFLTASSGPDSAVKTPGRMIDILVDQRRSAPN